MSEVPPQPTRSRSRLVLGLFLIALGGVMLAANLGFVFPMTWWRYFPAVFVALGVWGILLPNRHLDRGGGVWLLAIGLFLFTGLFDWFGLGWTGSWPIFVIAAGLSFMFNRLPESRIDSPNDPSGDPRL